LRGLWVFVVLLTTLTNLAVPEILRYKVVLVLLYITVPAEVDQNHVLTAGVLQSLLYRVLYVLPERESVNPLCKHVIITLRRSKT